MDTNNDERKPEDIAEFYRRMAEMHRARYKSTIAPVELTKHGPGGEHVKTDLGQSDDNSLKGILAPEWVYYAEYQQRRHGYSDSQGLKMPPPSRGFPDEKHGVHVGNALLESWANNLFINLYHLSLRLKNALMVSTKLLAVALVVGLGDAYLQSVLKGDGRTGLGLGLNTLNYLRIALKAIMSIILISAILRLRWEKWTGCPSDRLQRAPRPGYTRVDWTCVKAPLDPDTKKTKTS